MKPAPMMASFFTLVGGTFCGRRAPLFNSCIDRNRLRIIAAASLRAQDVGEVARLDPQRGVHRQLQSLIDALHDGARGRIIVVGLAAIDRVAGREHHHAGLGIDRAAGQLEALLVPGRHRLAAALDPVLCGLDHIGRRHHGIDELQRLGLSRLIASPFSSNCIASCGEHARHALRAAAAGKQPDLDLGQAETGLRIVGRNAVMARQRQFETAAEREAVDRGDPRLAARFRSCADVSDNLRLSSNSIWLRGFLALGFLRLGIRRFMPSSIDRSAPAQNASLPEVMTTPLTAASAVVCIDDRLELVDRGDVQHVHRTAGNVPRHQRDAVGVGFELEVLVRPLAWFLCPVPLILFKKWSMRLQASGLPDRLNDGIIHGQYLCRLPRRHRAAVRIQDGVSADRRSSRKHRVWGYEALVRGANGESAYSILNQVTDETCATGSIRLRACMAIETAGRAVQDRQDLRLSINFMPNAVYEPSALHPEIARRRQARRIPASEPDVRIHRKRTDGGSGPRPADRRGLSQARLLDRARRFRRRLCRARIARPSCSRT